MSTFLFAVTLLLSPHLSPETAYYTVMRNAQQYEEYYKCGVALYMDVYDEQLRVIYTCAYKEA